MVTPQRMIGRIAYTSNLVEKPPDLEWDNSMILQPMQKVVLGLRMRRALPDGRCDELGKKLAKLAHLEQSAIGIFSKVILCQHPQADELLVVNLKMGEVCVCLRLPPH